MRKNPPRSHPGLWKRPSHADKTITVTETLRLRLPEHEAYELFLDLPDDAEAQAGDVAILSSQAVLDPQWNQVKFNRDQDVQLQLNYTLRCFQDDDAQRDTFLLDLGRSPLDLPVEQMHAEIQFDPGLVLRPTGFSTAAKAAVSAVWNRQVAGSDVCF